MLSIPISQLPLVDSLILCLLVSLSSEGLNRVLSCSLSYNVLIIENDFVS
jgi:hypothetical protein